MSEVRSATKFRPTNSIKDRTLGLVALVDEKGKNVCTYWYFVLERNRVYKIPNLPPPKKLFECATEYFFREVYLPI